MVTKTIDGGDTMDLALFLGALVGLAVAAYFPGHDSRDGCREWW